MLPTGTLKERYIDLVPWLGIVSLTNVKTEQHTKVRLVSHEVKTASDSKFVILCVRREEECENRARLSRLPLRAKPPEPPKKEWL